MELEGSLFRFVNLLESVRGSIVPSQWIYIHALYFLSLLMFLPIYVAVGFISTTEPWFQLMLGRKCILVKTLVVLSAHLCILYGHSWIDHESKYGLSPCVP